MNASVIARAGGATARVVVRRPPFVDMWSNYPRGSERDVYGLIAGTFDDMLACIRRNWGAAELVVAANGRDVRAQFAGKKGVMAFVVSGWPSAGGHITLWDGAQCADRDYFTHEPQPEAPSGEEQPFPDAKTTEVLLWELK